MISPLVKPEDIEAVSRQMGSFWIGRGSKVALLEEVMADWVSAKRCVVFGSGTAALVVAMRSMRQAFIDYPKDVCDAFFFAANAAKVGHGRGPKVTIYPDVSGDIVDFARHLPVRKEHKLEAAYGIFSFGALKDVSGGIGGAIVSDHPIYADDMKRISPLSDINAVMVLSQLKRYRGHLPLRLVADGKTWSREHKHVDWHPV